MSNQVAIGKFGSPFGVRGWLKVISFTDPIQNILDYLPWYITKGHDELVIDNIKGKRQGDKPGCVIETMPRS